LFRIGIGEEKLLMKQIFKKHKFLILVYSARKKLPNDVGSDWNVAVQGQSCFDCSDWRNERVCLVQNRFFTVDSVKCLQLSFVWLFWGEELTVFGLVRGEYVKNFDLDSAAVLTSSVHSQNRGYQNFWTVQCWIIDLDIEFPGAALLPTITVYLFIHPARSRSNFVSDVEAFFCVFVFTIKASRSSHIKTIMHLFSHIRRNYQSYLKPPSHDNQQQRSESRVKCIAAADIKTASAEKSFLPAILAANPAIKRLSQTSSRGASRWTLHSLQIIVYIDHMIKMLLFNEMAST